MSKCLHRVRAALRAGDWRRTIVLLWAVQFIAISGVSLGFPFVPLYLRELGVTELSRERVWSQVLTATFFLCSALMAPLWGAWADRRGRKKMVVRALVGSGLGIAAMAFVHSPLQLLVVRALQGMSGGLVSAVAALAASTVPQARMGYALGLLQTALTSGHLIGPYLGGFVADHYGYRVAFVLAGGVCLLSTVLVITAVHEDFQPWEESRAAGYGQSFRLLRESAALRQAALAILLAQLALMIVQPILPLFIKSLLPPGTPRVNQIVGLVSALPGLGALLAAPQWGRYGDRAGHDRVMGIALFGSCLVYAPQAFVASIGALAPWRFMAGVFNAGIAPSAQAIAGRSVDESRTAAALSLMTFFRMMGGVVGPLSGALLSGLDWHYFFLLTALLQLVGAVFVFRQRGGQKCSK
jgi:DHA1 family multidrug resistance protein-like MFS transporter